MSGLAKFGWLPPVNSGPVAAELPAWIEELKRDFPELSWEKRGWIAARIDRDVKQWDRYLKGETIPDRDKIQEFRERLEAHRQVDQMMAARRRSKGHFAAAPESDTTPHSPVTDASSVTIGKEGVMHERSETRMLVEAFEGGVRTWEDFVTIAATAWNTRYPKRRVKVEPRARRGLPRNNDG